MWWVWMIAMTEKNSQRRYRCQRYNHNKWWIAVRRMYEFRHVRINFKYRSGWCQSQKFIGCIHCFRVYSDKGCKRNSYRYIQNSAGILLFSSFIARHEGEHSIFHLYRWNLHGRFNHRRILYRWQLQWGNLKKIVYYRNI